MEVALSENPKVDSLRAQHAALEAKLEEEISRPHPDDMSISELKREKLRIKDRISSLEH
jgi:hypothetical protein